MWVNINVAVGQNPVTPLTPQLPVEKWTEQREGGQRKGIWVLTHTHMQCLEFLQPRSMLRLARPAAGIPSSGSNPAQGLRIDKSFLAQSLFKLCLTGTSTSHV